MGRLYYDKNCSFCCRIAQLGQEVFSSASVEWVPADFSDLKALPLPVNAIIYEEGGKCWVKTEAIRLFLHRAGHPFLAALLSAIPLRWRDRIYDWIAKHRFCFSARINPSQTADGALYCAVPSSRADAKSDP
ncbi:MAG: DCC1-like thiol-disulfide oxidoreductase family protein [Bacteroidia bacterium]|nr:DCC1-like thiol-disulfide oxidoreductase family protein [Bacteroidia bacterium]MDW8015060.1 DCC1-like thiol-disulfide oxidoreductase family protein [Bacteroidia bacterium]